VNRACTAVNLAGLALIGLGVLFVVDQLFHINLMRLTWPFFIILPGVALLTWGIGSRTLPLTIFGSLVTATAHFPLTSSPFITSKLGLCLGTLSSGCWCKHDVAGHVQRRNCTDRAGQTRASVGVVLFLIGWVFFELVIGISGFP